MRIVHSLTSYRVAYLQRGIFRQAAFGAGVVCGVVGVLALASSWTSVRILAPASPLHVPAWRCASWSLVREFPLPCAHRHVLGDWCRRRDPP
jgi:hypothetical protein